MARRAEASAEPRVRLSKDRVLRAAMSIADKDGIDALTMRKLAEDLGVEAMSLYYYVTSKDDLLSGIGDLVVREIEAPSGGADWKGAIRTSAISYHDALARHPWATSLMTSGLAGVSPAHLRYSDALLRRFREAGFSPVLTHHAYHALDSHIVGSTLWAANIGKVMKAKADFVQTFIRELPVDEYPYFAEHVQQHVTKSVRTSGKSEFEFGLDLLLDGLENIRNTASRPSVSIRPRRDRSVRPSGSPKRRRASGRPS